MVQYAFYYYYFLMSINSYSNYNMGVIILSNSTEWLSRPFGVLKESYLDVGMAY